MAYLLTEDDMNRLKSLGFKMDGVMVGEEATPSEVEALNIQKVDAGAIDTMQTSTGAENIGNKITSDAGAPFISPEAAKYGADKALGKDPLAASDAQSAPDTSFARSPTAASSVGGLLPMSIMQPQSQQFSTDPFEGLSRNQKMMLAFSAIQDAGLALQGKQGGAFEKTLGRFNETRDIERKRQAAAAQQALMAKLYGGGGQGMAAPADFSAMGVDQLEAYRRQILQGGFQLNPITGEPLIPTDITKFRIEEIDRAIAAKKLGEKKATSEQEQIDMLTPIVSGALDYINPNGAVGENGEPVLNPDIASKITRGWAAFSEDPNYMRFSNQLETLKSTYTFENMTRLKEQGVAFGGLSEGELGQVAALIGTLDPKDPLGTFATLKRINEKLNKKAAKTGATKGGDGLTFNPETGEWE